MKKILKIVTRVSAYIVFTLSFAPVFIWVAMIESGSYNFLEYIIGSVLAFALMPLMFILGKGLEVVSNVCE